MKSQLFLSIGAVALAGSFLFDPRPAQTAEGPAGAANAATSPTGASQAKRLDVAAAASVPADASGRQAALGAEASKH